MKQKRRTVLKAGVALAAASLAGCASSKIRGSAALKSRTDAVLSRAVSSGDVPGVVAAVTNADQTIYDAAFGVRQLGQSAAMSADTVMWIASMGKPIVGAAAMQLVEQGKLALDEPAAKVIPELATFQVLDGFEANGEPRLRPQKTQMTLRHLMTHTAGFGYEFWNPDLARYYRVKNPPRIGSGRKIALRQPLLFDPGQRWEYGINIDWVGQLVEAASGMRLGAYITRNITGPLGMDSTSFKISPAMRTRLAKVHTRNAAGVLAVSNFETVQDPEFEAGPYSTASDYLKFMRMMLNGGRGNGNQVLKPDTVALMSKNAMGDLRVHVLPTQNPALTRDAEFFVGTPKSWSLTFMINEEKAPTGRPAGSIGWAGFANTFFWIDLRNDVGGLIMMQILPFVDQKALDTYYGFEKTVYDNLA